MDEQKSASNEKNSSETSKKEEKINPAIIVAVITGIVTLLTTLIAAVIGPIVVKQATSPTSISAPTALVVQSPTATMIPVPPNITFAPNQTVVTTRTAFPLFTAIPPTQLLATQPCPTPQPRAPVAASQNSVKIVYLCPDSTQILYVGDRVEIRVEVDYSTTQEPSVLAINIQPGEITAATLNLGSTREVVRKGAGTISWSKVIVVPDGIRSILVIAGFPPSGGTQSTYDPDMKFFKVEKR